MKRWIHAKSEIINFPETISILLYPTTDTWVTYTKDYEHEGGGCYYRTKDSSDPVLSNFVSLYPDGSLTYLWEGVEKPLNHKWREVVETSKVCAKSDKKRDIEYKIKSYLAAWARDDVKNGSPVATYDEFDDEMKDLGFKSDRDKYDYYIACYNNASEKNK